MEDYISYDIKIILKSHFWDENAWGLPYMRDVK